MARDHERGPPERERPALAGTGALEKTGKDEVRKYGESRTESPVLSRLADLAKRIKVEHVAYVAAVRQSLSRAMAAGDLLLEAKAQLNHGEWLPWLAEHCGIPERTASRYMKLARNRATIEAEIGHVADLTVRAAVALLTPDDPDDATDAAFFAPAPSCSGNDEWYTPTEWVDRARSAMGSIDLDPASCELAQRAVKAATGST